MRVRAAQLRSFEDAPAVPGSAAPSSSFVPNVQLAVHRWFRYSAGFSGAWVEELIRSRAPTQPDALVLDPFAGVATTLIASQLAGRRTVGLEAHPFVVRLAHAKLRWPSDPAVFERYGVSVVERASRLRASRTTRAPAPLLVSAFSSDALENLERLRRAIEETAGAGAAEHELAWLALVSILRSCSVAGTAPWQYVLPKKQKARVATPFEQFRRQVSMMAFDMRELRARLPRDAVDVSRALLLRGDARTCEGVEAGSVDLVVTSPPYPNNYDYADATRLEQTFLGEVDSWGDLQQASRRFLVRACSQHSAAERLVLEELLDDDALRPIRSDVARVCTELAHLREARAGKKTYHTMIAAYFADMARVWTSLARVVRAGGHALFVIGDSAPYGVYVPVDEWLRKLAEAAGFSFVGFRELRKRNVKWKNRKHRTPLVEGELLVVRR
jgi:DNA modification methylase